MKLFLFLCFVLFVLGLLYLAGVFNPVVMQMPQSFGPSADAWAKVCEVSGLLCH